jgi:hypothetical protein
VRASSKPTIPPPFDVSEYARAVAGSEGAASLRRPAADAPSAPSSQVRIVGRPIEDSFLKNESWARTVEGVPRVVLTADEIKQLPLDHRAGFLLSLMDGSVDFDSVVELSGLDRGNALEIARELYESGALIFR